MTWLVKIDWLEKREIYSWYLWLVYWYLWLVYGYLWLVYWYIWHIAHLTQQLLMLIGLMIIVLYVQNIHGELILPFVKDSHSC